MWPLAKKAKAKRETKERKRRNLSSALQLRTPSTNAVRVAARGLEWADDGTLVKDNPR
jgi:hypothetical protein